MKFRALAAIILLLVPLMPIALANQPTPPYWFVELRIRPTDSDFTGPCIVSSEFTKDVYLWNDKSLTGYGVYAYDFYVYWPIGIGPLPTLFSLTDATVHIPWPEGSYFIIKNETVSPSPVPGCDAYHLAVTAVGNSSLNPALELGATGTFNASLLTLTFHIDDEICWPTAEWMSFRISIGNELGTYFADDWNSPPLPAEAPILSTGCGVRIDRLEIANGFLNCFFVQPNVDPLVPTDDPGYIDEHTFMEDSIGETHTVTIAFSNITKAYGYHFQLLWDPLWYDTDIQHVTILPAFAPPYEYIEILMDPESGYLNVTLTRPCEKPTIHAAGYTPVVEVIFTTTNTPMIGHVPYAANTTFAITFATLFTKCPFTPVYSYPEPWPTLTYSGDITQMFVPKSRADITIDGVVDIEDLALLAEQYGLVHPWSDLADPISPAPVDIFDLVYVAKRYGDP